MNVWSRSLSIFKFKLFLGAVHFISVLLVSPSYLGRSWCHAVNENEYLFTLTGVKKMKWFLSLTRCHFQPRVTEGHEWLEMAPSVK